MGILTYLTVLTTLMYIWSGVSKILSMGQQEAGRLAGKLPMVPKNLIPLIILAAGIWELVAASSAIYASFEPKKYQLLGSISTMSLTVFTILASLIFYTFPFKTIPFLANLTAIGGLLTLSQIYNPIMSTMKLIF